MEKKEARIKCHGCGTTFKLKVPVSDKPINFTCKKCGKVLKIKLKASPTEASPPPAPPEPKASEPVIETNQMGDFADDDFGSLDQHQMPSGEHEVQAPKFDDAPVTEEDKRRFESTQLPEFEDGEDIGVDLSAPPSQFETGPLDDLELTQLPEEGSYQNAAGAPPVVTQSPADDAPQLAMADGNRRWIVLDEDLIKGPFSDEEILEMIREGEVKAETSLRMGERPWIKASEIANFRKYFHVEPRPSADSRLAQFSLLDQEPEDAAHAGTGKPFYTELASILPYPVGRGNPVPLAIFAGIVFVLSTILSLEFLIALPINLIGWIILYGYLSQLMNYSKQYPTKAPPAWDFSRVKEMGIGGLMVLLVLLVYSLIPVTVSLLLTIFFFLNSMAELGYAFIGLTVIFYLASLYFVPGSLLILEHSGNLGAALNPMKILAIIRKGGKAYRMLAAVSIAAGLACMAITIVAVFLTDIPAAGFVVAGLLMALVLSYAHFIWFHVLGRFSMENKQLLGGRSAA